MNEFQLILAIVALGVFILFFKQLFSGNYPKRGIDFEANTTQDKIGGISRPDKIFKKDNPQIANKSRIEELFEIAQKSLDTGDNIEAKKALQSLLILEPQNIDALRMLGVANTNMNDYSSAKENFLEILKLDSSDDLTHNLLANVLHKLAEEQKAIEHHKKAIELDNTYAPYYFNYANTLYDLKEYAQALKLYKKAYELDNNLEEAKKMIKELENVSNQ